MVCPPVSVSSDVELSEQAPSETLSNKISKRVIVTPTVPDRSGYAEAAYRINSHLEDEITV